MGTLLEMPMTELSDAPARIKALDIERSWIVEAPAGSGKTGLLIQRFLRLLADPNVTEPDQVLAITFTKAATQEIRERVVRELQAAQEGVEPKLDYDRATRVMASAVLARDQAMGWRLLEDPRRLRVQTIDSVCAEIARSSPILCGGNSSLTPVEEASSLYQEAARRTWLHLGGEDVALSDALRDLLLHRDGDLAACVSLVADMLGEREQWCTLLRMREEALTDEALDSQAREHLDQTLELVICDELSRLASVFPEQTLRRLASLAHSLSDHPGRDNLPSPIAICRELQDAPLAVIEHLAHWRALIHLLVAPSKKTWRTGFNKNHLRFELSAKESAALKELSLEIQQSSNLLDLLNDVRHLPPSKFPTEHWPITKALLRILRQALSELQIVFSDKSLCDFVEPALLASHALSQRDKISTLAGAQGADLKHLLVDEMQDTSTRQYDLIERLTEGWENERKTVFLVGDPKQSIYLFRQARVERFIETMRTEKLGTMHVGLLQLTANFRSQAGLISAFNQDFSTIFPQEITRAEEVSYLHVSATRPPATWSAEEDSVAWHLDVTSDNPLQQGEEKRVYTRRNARRLREIVERWQSRPLPIGRQTPWKIAVLVRSRSSLTDVLPELKRSSPIAFRADKIDPLKERPEILDLLSLTRALLHPADRTAWLAVLHAPWCGLGLADLHILTGRDDERSLGRTMRDLIVARCTELGPEGLVRLERVWPVLEAAIRSSTQVRLPELVERTWRSLGGNTFLDDTALRNADAFLDLLRAIDREAGEVQLADLTRRLQRLYASSHAPEGAVELVTIHRSKGLEWDVVFVPELERRSPRTASHLFEWEELLNGRVVFAPMASKGEEAAALNRWLRRLRSRREAAERKRLFYVACTRAREELHLFGVVSMRQDGTKTADSGSLLEAAWPAAEFRGVQKVNNLSSKQAHGGVFFEIAASCEEKTQTDPHAPTLQRLPLDAELLLAPVNRVLPVYIREDRETAAFESALHGSFSARCLGTAVHIFLEQAANRLRSGSSSAGLVADLPTWEPRIRAWLRANGLPPRILEDHVHTVTKAIRRTLLDPVGNWILSAQSEARSEFALASREEPSFQFRIDRIFRAGPSPGEIGYDYLWIIDYKTSSYMGNVLDAPALKAFLQSERLHHAAQLERYSRLIGEDRIQLGLWFPLIGQLTSWRAGQSEADLDLKPDASLN